MRDSWGTVVAVLAVIVAVAVILLSRPYDGGLFHAAAKGGDWSEHFDRIYAVARWQAREDPVTFLQASDLAYPPLLHWVMGLVGSVVGHGEEAIGRAMPLWLLLLAAAVGLCAFRLSGSARLGWLVVAGTAATPALGAIALTYYFDLPMTALLWTSVAVLLLLRPVVPEVAGFLAGAFWFLAAITKWTALPFGAAMLAGALLVHLPDERWTWAEVLRRIRVAVVAGVTLGLAVNAWFSLTTVSWRAMNYSTTGDPGAWSVQEFDGFASFVASVLDKLQPFSWDRLAAYPVGMVTSVLSPLIAFLALVLFAAWLLRDRRGAAFVISVAAGQWAVLFWLVPPADPRFLLTLTPALLIACAFGLEALPSRIAPVVLSLWAAIALVVVWDVHHGSPHPLNARWVRGEVGQEGLLTGRGLSLDSGDLNWGWKRADGGPTRFFPHRERLWAGLVSCGATHLAIDEVALGDQADQRWWRYRNLLARVEGDPSFAEVVLDQDSLPRGTPAVSVTRGHRPAGMAWESAGRFGDLSLWRTYTGLCQDWLGG